MAPFAISTTNGIDPGDFEPVLTAPAAHGDVFCFIDPPYLIKTNGEATGTFYEGLFTKKDHERLFELLKATPHKWLLTINRCKFTIDTYVAHGFNVIENPWKYLGVPPMDPARKAKRRAEKIIELIVWNY